MPLRHPPARRILVALLLTLVLSGGLTRSAAADSATPVAADANPGALGVSVFTCADAAADPEIVAAAPACPEGGTAALWIDGTGPTNLADGGSLPLAAGDHAVVNSREYDEALSYIAGHPGVREVIFSGGDPLTVSDGILDRALSDVRAIGSVEVIRVHTRMPVVAPMRITDELVQIFKKNKPVYLITHFNHPQEISAEAAMALEKLVDHGVPVLNQMVLLNGINNHPAIVQALSRRLLYLRVKPYYMF